MNKEEKKKYVFAQLKSLPNTFQYVEVVEYIKSLEQENANLKQALNEIREYINKNRRIRLGVEYNSLETSYEPFTQEKLKKNILQIIDRIGDEK